MGDTRCRLFSPLPPGGGRGWRAAPGEGRSAGSEAAGAALAASAPLRGAALIPLPGPSPTGRWEKGIVAPARETRAQAPPFSAPPLPKPLEHPQPRTVSRRGFARRLPPVEGTGRRSAQSVWWRRMYAPPQGALRHPRLSAPRVCGVAWVPVLPLAVPRAGALSSPRSPQALLPGVPVSSDAASALAEARDAARDGGGRLYPRSPRGRSLRVFSSRGSPPSTPRAPVRPRLRPSEWTRAVWMAMASASRVLFLSGRSGWA